MNRYATMQELEETYSIEDVDAANRALDAWEAAQRGPRPKKPRGKR